MPYSRMCGHNANLKMLTAIGARVFVHKNRGTCASLTSNALRGAWADMERTVRSFEYAASTSASSSKNRNVTFLATVPTTVAVKQESNDSTTTTQREYRENILDYIRLLHTIECTQPGTYPNAKIPHSRRKYHTRGNQNPDVQTHLLSTGDGALAEARPYGRFWARRFRANHISVQISSSRRGKRPLALFCSVSVAVYATNIIRGQIPPRCYSPPRYPRDPYDLGYRHSRNLSYKNKRTFSV